MIDSEYSGMITNHLWVMTDVEEWPLLKGHTFPNKDVMLMRIQEETNLCGKQIIIDLGDYFQVRINEMYGGNFKVKAAWN